MKQHGTETGHSMVLSFADISVWCYTCDAYVHHHVSCMCVSGQARKFLTEVLEDVCIRLITGLQCELTTVYYSKL